MSDDYTGGLLGRFRNDIVGFSSHILGIKLFPRQAEILETATQVENGVFKFPFVNISGGNRAAKTSSLAIATFWMLTYKKGLEVEGREWADYPWGSINLAPLVDLANVLRNLMHGILLNRAKEQIANPDGRGKCLLAPLFETAPGGGFLVSFGEYKGFRTKFNAQAEFRTTDDDAKAVQGLPKFFVTVDEAARQKDFRKLMGAHVVPRTLDVGGVIWCGSTPDVDTSTDYDEWFGMAETDPKVYSTYMSVRDNPYVGEARIQRMLSGVPEYLHPQVLDGKFVQPTDAFFSSGSIDRAFDSGVHEDPERRPGRFYVIGADLAVAKAGDRSIFVVWDATELPFRMIRLVTPPRGTGHPQLIADMKALLEYYEAEWKDVGGRLLKSEAALVYDSTGMGGKIFKSELSTLIPRPRGYDFGGMTGRKMKLIGAMRFILEKGWIKIPSEYLSLKKEMKGYRRRDSTHLETDMVMAMALAAYVAERSLPMSAAEPNPTDWEAITP